MFSSKVKWSYYFSLGVVFDPLDLSLEVTPKAIKESLKEKDFSKALIMALKLNETNMINLALESIPYIDSKLLLLFKLVYILKYIFCFF